MSSEKLKTMLSPMPSTPSVGSGVPNSCGRRVSFTPLTMGDAVVRKVLPLRQKSTARMS